MAGKYGWRFAFFMAGAPGLLLALIVRWVLAEPRRQLGFPRAEQGAETFLKSITYLRRKRSYLLTLMGVSLYCIFAYGIWVFVPTFMIRSLHTTLEQVSMVWGSTIAAANLVGAIVGGRIADRLSRRDVRWYAWLPALACATGLPLYWIALMAERVSVFIAVEVLAELMISIGTPVAFVAVLAVCGREDSCDSVHLQNAVTSRRQQAMC